jgi:hypothetical protein
MYFALTIWGLPGSVWALRPRITAIWSTPSLTVLPQSNQEFAFGGVSGNTLPEEHP